MAEGTSLLRKHTAYTRIVGSNPTVSAKIVKKPLIFKGFFYVLVLNPRFYPRQYMRYAVCTALVP